MITDEELYRKCVAKAGKRTDRTLTHQEFEKIVPSNKRESVVSLMVHGADFLVGPCAGYEPQTTANRMSEATQEGD